MSRLSLIAMIFALSSIACGDTPTEPEPGNTSTSEIAPGTPEPDVPRSDTEGHVDERGQQTFPGCIEGGMACVHGVQFVCARSHDGTEIGHWISTGQPCLHDICLRSPNYTLCGEEEAEDSDGDGHADGGDEERFDVQDETTTNPGPDHPDSNSGSSRGSGSSGSSSGSSGPSVNTSGQTQPGAGGGGSSVGHGL